MGWGSVKVDLRLCWGFDHIFQDDNLGMFKHYISRFSQILPPSVSARSAQVLTPCPTLICWCNTWEEGELLDDFYDMFQIIKICFSIIIRNVFWGVGAVFKEFKAWLRKKFISLLISSSIVRQYLLYVSFSIYLRPPPPKTCLRNTWRLPILEWPSLMMITHLGKWD